MSTTTTFPEIKDIGFVNDKQMVVYLENGRALLIPLEHFPPILAMTESEKMDFEVIDGYNLSFLCLDEIFSIQELIGVGISNAKVESNDPRIGGVSN
ncbi:hypothetical protein ADIS_3153 [Lunatimonas lonarensis]|uniref:DUF2442 domain-containing protein n=1 Tax=Lunatimonas lonarensis TaxID=1232681 RepID=R7ZQH6_9BACT|nr:DUF2442 domain-containing protein [Lunatimonas lonarensis]EON76365.1 hypothetical protein ADIS_3153 [Lunatimonas lonarensis]